MWVSLLFNMSSLVGEECMMVAIYNMDFFSFFPFLVFFSDGKSTVTMEDILIFATGCSSIPPAGFKPTPSIECLHMDFPVGNKCNNCLALPITSTYKEFQENMDFAIKNTLRLEKEENSHFIGH